MTAPVFPAAPVISTFARGCFLRDFEKVYITLDMLQIVLAD